MKHRKKFASQEQQQVSEAQSQQTAEREFASVEELLRYDAQQTELPAEVARRLNRSLPRAPGAPRSWWRRWLGKP
jgi:hypothetical protein